jgi:hypothetical protein
MKYVEVVAGAAEIALGAALFILIPGAQFAGVALMVSGAGTVMTGIGTILAKGPMTGIATTTRNPTAPWKIVYGRARVGGTIVHMHMWGDSDKMLDLVIVLAAHKCQSVDVVLFDMQRIQIDIQASWINSMPGSGTSFTPVQQNHINITTIQRSHGVVQVTLPVNIPYLIVGDEINVAEDSSGLLTQYALIGTFHVAQILEQTSTILVFTYLSGGLDVTISSHGHVNTRWANYGRKVYFEWMDGTQALGTTFTGMTYGTPYDGNMDNIVSPEQPGGLGGSTSSQPNPWTANCSLQGKTSVFLRLHYNQQYFQGGLPQISFLIHGKTDIYDPRTGTNGYTENSALCIADFLVNTKWGLKLAMGTDIPTANLTAAANTCDEQVPLRYSLVSPALTEPAYTCNGAFELTMKRGEILQNLLTSCAGRITRFDGQWIIWPAAWTGVSFAIGSNPGGGITSLPPYYQMAAGPVKWKPTVQIRDLYNGVKGTFISPYAKWTAADFPPYAQDTIHGYIGDSAYDNDANLKADGGDRRWFDIQLPFTISSSMAQRIAKIELLRRRHFGMGTLVLNMVAWQITTLDILEVTLPYLSWSAKLLEVIEATLRIEEGGAQGGPGGEKTGAALFVELTVQETDASIYQWSTAEELSPQGTVQPAIPGIGTLLFFATEKVPGYSVPYPWGPGYLVPLKGDALYPTPVVGSNTHGFSTFGIQVVYGRDAQGNATANFSIQGHLPANILTNTPAPSISVTRGTSGSLTPGRYLVAASSIYNGGTVPNDTALSVPHEVTIPQSSPPGANNGSIAVTINWPTNSNGGLIYMASSFDVNGYYSQTQLPVTTTSYTITTFDKSGFGPPDGTFDHLAVSWKKLIHGGVWAATVRAVTSNTITVDQYSGDAPMTANQWAGRVLMLFGKIDPTKTIPVLNMPVSASSASFGGSPPPAQFSLTIGPNAHGDQLPDLTTLIQIGDLVMLRMNPTFSSVSLADPMIANPYYPNGADPSFEVGHQLLVLSGPDAGDIQTIAGMGTDGSGHYTIYRLASPWKVTPNAGDIVVVVEAEWGPEIHTKSYSIASNTATISGVLMAPLVQNLIGQSWIFIVRSQTVSDLNGADDFAPVREAYFFGNQITRNTSGTDSQQLTDGTINVMTATGPGVINLLPQTSVLNQNLLIQKVGADANTVTVLAAAGDYLDTSGTTSITLHNDGDKAYLKFSG